MSRVLLPREHGAYGQLLLPLLSALALGAPRAPALALSLAALAAFFGHEPLLTLLGHRGPRTKAQHGKLASRALLGCLTLGLAGVAFAARALAGNRDLLAIPLVLAAPVLFLALKKRERTLGGELLASSALAAWAIPIAFLAGASRTSALSLGFGFSLSFALATFAVRGIIANHKHPEEARGLRASGALAALGVLAGAAVTAMAGAIPSGLGFALGPVATLALALCTFPPHPRQLNRIGFTMLGACIATSLLLITSLRG